MVTPNDMAPAVVHATAADSDELPGLDASRADAGHKRAQRREQVRRRVEAVLDRPLRDVGPDYVLPDGRLVAIYYSRTYDDGGFFLGVKNRIQDDDILVLLLGDETNPVHLVFPGPRTCFATRKALRRSETIAWFHLSA
jgi:hypothetical protein